MSLNYLRYQISRRKLIRDAEAASAYLDDALSRAKARRATRAEIDEICWEHQVENQHLYDALAILESRRLIGLALELRVPTPDRHSEPEAWEELSSGDWALSNKGLSDLRTAVREEQNARWQFWEIRAKTCIGFGTVLAGVIGVATGFLALWKF